MTTTMTLQEAIDSLGPTQASVSRVLRLEGIRGVRQLHCGCPVATYVAAHVERHGIDILSVTHSNVGFIHDGSLVYEEGNFIPLPTHVRRWVGAFDKGLLPEFEVDSGVTFNDRPQD